MIRSRLDYVHYLEADRVALGREKPSVRGMVKRFFFPDHIWIFQRSLRKVEFYKNVHRKSLTGKIGYFLALFRFKRLSVKLGFTIPENVFGPGLAIVHVGTIVVNHNARVGANCRIHVCTNIGASGGSDKAPVIGDNVYIAPGVKIFGDISIASNTAFGANAVVNKSITEEGMLVAGVPAKVIQPIDIKTIIKHL